MEGKEDGSRLRALRAKHAELATRMDIRERRRGWKWLEGKKKSEGVKVSRAPFEVLGLKRNMPWI